MSAQELRQAAALIRERAEAAEAQSGPEWYCRTQANGCAWIEPAHIAVHGYGSAAEHIASWHPAVAVLAADWLDGVALLVEAKDDEEYFDLDGDPIAPEDTHAIGSALNVARAYLGSES